MTPSGKPSRGGSTAQRILLVDDSELTRESVKAILEDVGLAVYTLAGPFGFIRSVRELRPSVILIDVGLGTMNGTKLVHLAREHAPEGCKILLYSGRSDEELDVDTRECRADGFISKRLTATELSTAVSRWAYRRQSG